MWFGLSSYSNQLCPSLGVHVGISTWKAFSLKVLSLGLPASSLHWVLEVVYDNIICNFANIFFFEVYTNIANLECVSLVIPLLVSVLSPKTGIPNYSIVNISSWRGCNYHTFLLLSCYFYTPDALHVYPLNLLDPSCMHVYVYIIPPGNVNTYLGSRASLPCLYRAA